MPHSDGWPRRRIPTLAAVTKITVALMNRATPCSNSSRAPYIERDAKKWDRFLAKILLKDIRIDHLSRVKLTQNHETFKAFFSEVGTGSR